MYERLSIFINILVILIMVFTVTINIRKNNYSMFNYDFQIKFYVSYILPLIFVIINICLNIVFNLSIKFWIVTMIPIIIPAVSYLFDIKKSKTDAQLYYKYSEKIKINCKEILETLDIKVSKEKIYVFLNDYESDTFCKIVIDYTLGSFNTMMIEKILKQELEIKYPNIRFEVIVEI